MFITFEGPEGGGKSTAIQAVASALRAEGKEVVLTREPGAGEFGQEVRRLLLSGGDICSESELFLFLADRANNIHAVVRPALESGAVVMCDRHADSTVVYQGYGRGLDIHWLKNLNESAVGATRPDLTFLFDLDPEIGLARIRDKDRMDSQPLEFHKEVRAGFLAEAALEPQRWVIVDASQAPEKSAEFCLSEIKKRL